MTRSTTELQQHGPCPQRGGQEARAIVRAGTNVKRCLSLASFAATSTAMDKPDPKAAREERLAARLRENLRRRKAQARQQGDSDAALPKPDPGG